MTNTTTDKFTVSIQIRDKKNRGGYDLYYNIDGNNFLISKDFNAGQLLKMDITYGSQVPLNNLTSSIRNSYIYSARADTWACDNIEVSCVDSDGGIWIWNYETSHIERNSTAGGPENNPVLFFMFDWTRRILPHFNTTYAENWMSNHLFELGNKPLSMICMPGSHDSGMSESKTHTSFAYDCNTITQNLDIYAQLLNGVRFFDIRPVIGGGIYYTGHYSNVNKFVHGTFGARGQSIENIIENINRFTSEHNELIILDLSHSKNTDKIDTNNYFPEFNVEEWAGLFSKLQSLNYLLIQNESEPAMDFRKTKLNYFINGKSCVIVIIDDLNSDQLKTIGYFKKGIYPTNENWFDHYDEYSDTNKHDVMAFSEEIPKGKVDPRGQIPKLNKYGSSQYFLLSWTLTQSDKQAFACGLDITGETRTILQLAENAKENYAEEIKPYIKNNIYPNIISMDGITDYSMVYLCMYINSVASIEKQL